MGCGEAEARQCSETERHLFLIDPDIRLRESMKRPLKTQGKSWKFPWKRLRCVSREQESAQGSHRKLLRVRAQTPTRKTKFVEGQKSTRKRLESTAPRNHEDHIVEKKGFNSMNNYSQVHCFYSCASSDENSGCDSSIGQKLGRSSKSCQPAIDHSKEQKRRSFLKHIETKIKSTLLH